MKKKIGIGLLIVALVLVGYLGNNARMIANAQQMMYLSEVANFDHKDADKVFYPGNTIA